MERSELDHIVIAASSLEAGAAWVEERLGTKPVPGGQHRTMGTHNALLRLGPRSYLEVIAIDPGGQAPTRPRWFSLDEPEMRARLATSPALITWVVRTSSLASACARVPDLGEPMPMARNALRWKISVPDGGVAGVGRHPADGDPVGGRRRRFRPSPVRRATRERLRTGDAAPGASRGRARNERHRRSVPGPEDCGTGGPEVRAAEPGRGDQFTAWRGRTRLTSLAGRSQFENRHKAARLDSAVVADRRAVTGRTGCRSDRPAGPVARAPRPWPRATRAGCRRQYGSRFPAPGLHANGLHAVGAGLAYPVAGAGLHDARSPFCAYLTRGQGGAPWRRKRPQLRRILVAIRA